MTIVTRMRMDPGTRIYVERRTTEGRTPMRSVAASSATSPAKYTDISTPQHGVSSRQLDTYRGLNGRLEHLRETASGFRNLTHHIVHGLLECGVKPSPRPRL